MNAAIIQAALRELIRNGLGAPLLILMTLAMMVVPMPPLMLDLFFSFNIALSLIILLSAVYVMRPLDLAIFPMILLVSTLLRLALNVASTRVVLLEGHTGPDAAGKVIESFGKFVIGGDYTVGLVVFAILVIINFAVVTKGAGRISEVSARFTLDALPGKQMAIDADVNAGLITQDQAQERRNEVRQEADFYGSMDGASKFVKGDAIAGILILLINIIGGLIVGTSQHGLDFSQAVHNYTLLTIGDGLVAQIPSLLLSTAAAILVTRVSRSQDMGEQVISQLFDQPRVLKIAGGVLGFIGVIPGMPHMAFLTLAAVCAGGAYFFQRAAEREVKSEEADSSPSEMEEQRPDKKEVSWEDVEQLDMLGLEVGYRLIPLVDSKQNGELMGRIKAVRKKLSKELGFLVPSVHVRDNLELGPQSYRVTLSGVPIGEGELYPERELAISSGKVTGTPKGITTKDPAFGLDAVWIEAGSREHAQTMGYTAVDASTVAATHLSQLIKTHAHELLGHDEVQELLDRLATYAPKLVEGLIPATLSLSLVVRVLQNLLREQVSIRDIRKIVESLADNISKSQDPDVLTAKVRTSLARHITQSIYGMADELSIMTLDPNLEQILLDTSQGGPMADAGLEPSLGQRLRESAANHANALLQGGTPAVLLVNDQLRTLMARLLGSSIPGLHVLGFNEVPDNKQLKLVASIGRAEEAAAPV